MNYRFSLDFQKHILASVISDKKFLRESMDVIRPEFFGDEILAGICDTALAFWKAHADAPSLAGLRQELKRAVAPGRKWHEYTDELEEVYKLVGINAGYYQDQAVQFARTQAVSGAVRAAIPLIEQGEIEEVGRMVSNALKVGSGANGEGMYDYLGMAAERIRHYLNGHSKEDRLATGLTILDECMSGGLGRGELGVVVSLPGHGKTTTLINFGGRALLQNKKVIYFTLELSKKMIALKFDNCIFGRSTEKIKNLPKEFAQALGELRNRLTGKLYIAEFPTKSLSLEKMQSVIEKIEGADIVMVDYGQLMKSPSRREDRRHEITEIYEGMRRIAGEMKVPLWTAHQSNRPGAMAKVLRMEHLAEDFNVAAISDICMSFNHNEEEGRIGRARFYIMKSRIGPSNVQIDLSVNWKTCSIIQNP